MTANSTLKHAKCGPSTRKYCQYCWGRLRLKGDLFQKFSSLNQEIYCRSREPSMPFLNYHICCLCCCSWWLHLGDSLQSAWCWYPRLCYIIPEPCQKTFSDSKLIQCYGSKSQYWDDHHQSSLYIFPWLSDSIWEHHQTNLNEYAQVLNYCRLRLHLDVLCPKL